MPSVLAQEENSDRSEEGTLSGTVFDAESGEPIPFCNAVLADVNRGAFSMLDGRFVIRSIPPGTYRLIVSHISYESTVEEAVTIRSDENTEVSIRLVPRILERDPVIVTATRREQTANAAPASVAIVEGEDIRKRQVTTFDQALNGVAGLTTFRSSPITVQSIQIRGSSDVAGGGVGNRVLLLLDGRPALTADSGGAFWSLIPTHSIDRIEIVKGAYSSLYGSTAMGGVVNVITRRPDISPHTDIDLKFGFFELPHPTIRYTENPRFLREIQITRSEAGKRAGYIVGASHKQSDGHAQNRGYSLIDLYARTIFNLTYNRNIEFTLSGGIAENDYPHTWLNTAQPLSIQPKFTDDRQLKRYVSGDLYYWAMPNARLKYSSRFYYYRHRQQSFFNEGDPERLLPGNEMFGTSTFVDGSKLGIIAQMEVQSGDHHFLVTGADIQIDRVESAPDTIMYGNREIDNLAIFFQEEYVASPSMTITVGGRLDWNHLVNGKTLRQFSPKMSIVWSPAAEISIRALFGRAFRAPTIAELFFQKEIAGGTEFVPNPDLRAERLVNSVEIGTRATLLPGITFDVALFRQDYADMIFWVNVSDDYGVTYPLFQVRNLNRARMQGIDASVMARICKGILTSANYTWLDAQDYSPGRENDTLPYRAEHTFNVAVDMESGKWNLRTESRFRSDIKEVFLYPLQAPSAYMLTSMVLRHHLTETLTLSLRINNLFDRQYEELARYRMPGRNLLLGVSGRF
ncbi:TonB-dependent receptor domain-containing protein [Candidatus Zixiibacteriota bacterium]